MSHYAEKTQRRRRDAPGSKTKREEGSMITLLLVDYVSMLIQVGMNNVLESWTTIPKVAILKEL